MIDPRSGLCFGCGRTLAEIGCWGSMESAERRALMALLESRMAAAGLAPTTEPARSARKP
jgi:predicted Fe-S protein YdhL (DUF1289 family)